MASTSLPRTRYRSSILLAALAVLAACNDDPVAPTRPPAQPTVQRVDATDAERAALRTLTRAAAMAMANPGVRQQVKNDMRASRVTREHKLHLASYLEGRNGGVLLAQMERASGLSRDTLQALVAAVRPLEFYMPVEKHRAAWVGGADVIVASSFDDHDVPVGFDTRGGEVTLGLLAPPEVPVLALVPVEADFRATLDEAERQGLRVRNADDRGGEAIGTYVIERSGDGGIVASEVAGVDDGFYMTYNTLNDHGENWIKGSPELEVHLHGPRNKDYPQHGEDLSCSGEHAQDYRKHYNQDGKHFVATIGSGAPLIADRYDWNQAQAKFPDGGRYFIMWEDDDTACVIKTDNDMLKIIAEAAAAAGAAAAAVKAKGGGTTGAVVTAVVTFVIKLFGNADFLRTNDDLVGIMVPKANAPNFASYPGTHIILKGSSYNGNADIIAQWATALNGRSYMANLATDVSTIETNMGGMRQLSATVYDQYGAVRSGHPVGWRSGSRYVANVSETGLLSMPSPGTTTVYARACDPECIDRAILVRVTGPVLSGPSYLSEGQMGTIYGEVVNPRHGSYWYEWSMQSCTNGSVCPSEWYPAGSGWNGPGQVNVWMGTYDAWTKVNLTVYTAPGGDLVGAQELHIAGPNQWPGCEPYVIDCQPFETAPQAAGGTTKPAAKAPVPATRGKPQGGSRRLR